MIIYKTTNLVNGKIYIGKDSNNNPGYIGSGTYLRLAIKKHGIENFKKEILEYCTASNINEREKYWIAKENSRDKKIGYNISPGGEGYNFTNDHDMRKFKNDLSARQKEIQNRPERKEFISKLHLGRKRPPETGKRISENKLEFYKIQENRDALKESLAKTINSPERLKERSESMKGKILCELSEESIGKIKDSVKTLWENPEYANKVKTNRRKALDEGKGRKSQEEIEKQKEKQSKKLYEYSPEWELIKVWDNIKTMKEHNRVSNTWQSRYLNKEKLMRGSYWRSELLEKDEK